jgi:hypothetical protein
MKGRTVQRGIVALAIVTSLAAAGPRPAAAMDLGLVRHQLSSLWSFVTGGPSPAPHRAESRPTKPGKATSQPDPDRGWGIDPNGNSITVGPGTPLTGG